MASIMQNANTLRKALNTGSGPSFGSWQMFPGTHLSRTIARAGFDWVCIDCEHGNMSDSEMHESVQAVASCHVSPIVRIADNQGWMVKRALDAGAHGVIVPLLESVDDAKKLVHTTKFPPFGRRGFGSPFSMGAFDVTGHLGGFDYMKNANENLLTVVQIETQGALDVVEGIAMVDGIDVLLIGPWDLGNNIGHPVSGKFDPELEAAIERIRKAALSAGKKAGIVCPSSDVARRYAGLGFQMIGVVTDVTAITTFMAESLANAKGSYGEASVPRPKKGAYSL